VIEVHDLSVCDVRVLLPVQLSQRPWSCHSRSCHWCSRHSCSRRS
jgi:hypothetical protein